MNIEVSKIDRLLLKTHEIVIIGFELNDKLKKIWFFFNSFLFTNINIKFVLKIFFFTFSKRNIFFHFKKACLYKLHNYKYFRYNIIDRNHKQKLIYNRNIKFERQNVYNLYSSYFKINKNNC